MGQNYSEEEEKQPEPGDLVKFDRVFYSHYGVAVDRDHVVHLTSVEPDSPGYNFSSSTGPKAVVKRDRISDVAWKNSYRVDTKYDQKRDPRTPEEIVRDATSMVGEKKNYNLFKNNCEHFATRLRYGKPDSKQAENGIIGSGTVGALLGLGVLAAVGVGIGMAVTERRNERIENTE